MNPIKVLDSSTINKIAAGEVVERPASVIKELVENAMDAKATSITVEIVEGGINMIRVTDNGHGMDKEALVMCFERHATSKIRTEEDLNSIQSLGFRGEALSSIASVSKVEAMSKEPDALIGTRLYMEGGKNPEVTELGLPTGTTFVVRNLFFNTPARRKFLKQPMAETNTITDLMEHLALSRPDISFKYVIQHKPRFQTFGNGNLRDAIYEVYGREIAKAMIPVEGNANGIHVSGYVGRPEFVRGTRANEIYFLNGRFIKSDVIANAVELGFKEYLMQHKFPFCVLHIEVDPTTVDVNVHPTKMDVRFGDETQVSTVISTCVSEALSKKEMIQQVSLVEEKVENPTLISAPEPFETKRTESVLEEKEAGYATKEFFEEEKVSKPSIWDKFQKNATYVAEESNYAVKTEKIVAEEIVQNNNIDTEDIVSSSTKAVQLDLFEEKLLTKEKRMEYRFIGQVFDTYWLIQYEDKLLMIDQHAAHEKIKYERLMKRFREKEIVSQTLMPPIVVTLSGEESSVYEQFKEVFANLGFGIEEFGGKEYTIREVPLDLYGYEEKELFIEVLDELLEKGISKNPDAIESRIATMACKSAVKGNNVLSEEEAQKLIDELLTLDNPYNCPHGRPTIITMSKYEMERKFKRIVT